MDDAILGVVVTAYNRPRYLKETLASMVSGLAEGDGILVMDDGSKEPIREIAESYAPMVAFGAGENVGLYGNLRRGFEWLHQSRLHSHLMIAQDDVEMLPGWRDAAIQALDADPALGFLSLIMGTRQAERHKQNWDDLKRRVRYSRFNVPMVATMMRAELADELLDRWPESPDPERHGHSHKNIDGFLSEEMKRMGFRVGFLWPPLALHMDQPDHPMCLRHKEYYGHTAEVLTKRWGAERAEQILVKEHRMMRVPGSWHFSGLDYFEDPD